MLCELTFCSREGVGTVMVSSQGDIQKGRVY